jgi:cyclase
MGLKKRVIPVLLLKEGNLVQSRNFSRHSVIGNPWIAAKRISSWSSDELVYLDITSPKSLAFSSARHVEILEKISGNSNVPLAFGGGIRSEKQVKHILQNGADKVVINTLIFQEPKVVREIVDSFGSQAVVASLDVREAKDGEFVIYAGGLTASDLSLESVVERIHHLGCGEILLNSIDRDGAGVGFNIRLMQRVASVSSVPVIALGGAGNWQHFKEVLSQTNVSAAAAANIFHHSENSVYECKKFLVDNDVSVRKPPPLNIEPDAV